jgi:hypothetical protein
MSEPGTIGVGSLTAGVVAEVDGTGSVRHGSLRLGWRLHTGDGWLEPGRDGPVRRSRPHPAPVVRTAMRVHGGDAVERVYAVGAGERTVVVVEVENDSPNAIAAGFVVEDAGGAAVDVDDAGVQVGGTRAVAFMRRPGAVEEGNRVVFPVPHRTTVRVAFSGDGDALDVRALASADAVERAWDAVLDRGMRTELPEPLQTEVDTARADLLLAPPSPEAFVALEAWGFDDEAVAMWAHLGMRARRAARRGAFEGILAEVRAALVREAGRTVEVLPGFRTAWLGQSLAAHDVPLRRGSCSFALRWHGARPALLWDVPAGTTLRAPVLDPAWSSTEPAGETLLAEPPTSLLALGTRSDDAGGETVEPPEQFS